MAAAKKKEDDLPEDQETKTPPKMITVYRGDSESAQIMDTDLEVWEKAGYTATKPISSLSMAEQWAALKRTLGAK